MYVFNYEEVRFWLSCYIYSYSGKLSLFEHLKNMYAKYFVKSYIRFSGIFRFIWGGHDY